MSDIIVPYNPYFAPVCNECKNFTPGTLSCKAFSRIPDEILDGKNDHSKPLTNQNNNIVFEQK